MRVFIGSEPSQARAERALVRSLAATSPDAEVVVMRAGDPGWRGFPKSATGFTLFRWCIPELMGFEGFAIYLDCDMLVLRDIAELYAYRQPGAWVQHPDIQGDCVSVIDCAAMPKGWPSIERIKGLDKTTLRGMVAPIVRRNIPDAWNCCDRYDPEAGLIHFTALDTQPWMGGKPHPDPRAVELWRRFA